MVHARIWMLLVVLSLLLVPLALAVSPPVISCALDADCSYCNSEFNVVCHCDKSPGAVQGLCLPQGTPAPVPPSPASTTDHPVDFNPEEFFDDVEDSSVQVTALEQRVIALEQQIIDLSTRISQFEGLLQSLQQQVGIISNQQELASLETKQELNTLSTGLAGLQKDVNETTSQIELVKQNVQQQESTTSGITYGIIIIIILGVLAGVGYYFFRGTASKSSTVQPQVLSYITSHIKNGKKFPEIRENLLKAGWSESDIQTAYKETMKHNYQKYQRQKGMAINPHSDNVKIASIAIVSVLLVVGIFFLLKGVTGQAIHFTSERELNAAIKSNLEIALRNQEFPILIDTATICVEVHDLAAVSSYRVIKLPTTHIIQEAPFPCSEDTSYDLALKFNNWDAFNIVTRRMTCEAFTSNHINEGYYVLPSRYILPGFTLNPATDPSPFCAVLTKCATSAELVTIGIAC